MQPQASLEQAGEIGSRALTQSNIHKWDADLRGEALSTVHNSLHRSREGTSPSCIFFQL